MFLTLSLRTSTRISTAPTLRITPSAWGPSRAEACGWKATLQLFQATPWCRLQTRRQISPYVGPLCALGGQDSLSMAACATAANHGLAIAGSSSLILRPIRMLCPLMTSPCWRLLVFPCLACRAHLHRHLLKAVSLQLLLRMHRSRAHHQRFPSRSCLRTFLPCDGIFSSSCVQAGIGHFPLRLSRLVSLSYQLISFAHVSRTSSRIALTMLCCGWGSPVK